MDILSRTTAIAGLGLLASLILYKFLSSGRKYPKNVPWVGREGNGYFANIKSIVASVENSMRNITEGYEKYGKYGKAYLMPEITGNPVMILPRSQMKWALDQPDSILGTHEWHYDALGGDYVFPHKSILRDPYHEHVIYKFLPRRLQNLLPEIQDEVAYAFDENWGTDTENWKTVKLSNSMQWVMSHLVNRMLVGLPLCRNEEFLEHIRRYVSIVPVSSSLISLIPGILQPFLAPIVALPSQIYYRKISRHSIPIIAARKAAYDTESRDTVRKGEFSDDFITWTIKTTDAENRLEEGSVNMISRRLMPIEFAAIHTSSITITQCIFDLAASKPSAHYLDAIRQEAQRALNATGGRWTKQSLAECKYADSAFRESARVSNFMTRNTMRKVISPDGLQGPDGSWYAPQGTTVAFDMHNVQHDPTIYTDAEKFDAFRFVSDEDIHAQKASSVPEKIADGPGKPRNVPVGMINTSDTWFPFSHGRHACPGRFFVAAEVRMILAYITMNYEIEHLQKRPENLRVGSVYIPRNDTTIRIRRRKATGPQKD